jgi:hypothetical protein
MLHSQLGSYERFRYRARMQNALGPPSYVFPAYRSEVYVLHSDDKSEHATKAIGPLSGVCQGNNRGKTNG